MADRACTCTMETRTGVVLDREAGCPIHGAAVVALAASGWERAGGSWPDSISGRHVIMGAVDAARAPLLAEVERLTAQIDEVREAAGVVRAAGAVQLIETRGERDEWRRVAAGLAERLWLHVPAHHPHPCTAVPYCTAGLDRVALAAYEEQAAAEEEVSGG